jgi:transcriptional regulator with XRE-family HTH domain
MTARLSRKLTRSIRQRRKQLAGDQRPGSYLNHRLANSCHACKRRDLGAVITVLCAHGITQGQLAALTGIPQGRLSEYKTRKRMPAATSTFEAFADGLGVPPAARRALGLAPGTADSGPLDSAGGRAADDAASLGDVRPLLGILTGQVPFRYCRHSA